MAKITVLGSGGWGAALAVMAQRFGHNVTLWSPFSEEINEIREHGEHRRLLPGVAIPSSMTLTTDPACVADAGLTLMVTPSFALEQTAERIRPYFKDSGILAIATKGLEETGCQRFSQIIENTLPAARVAVLSGPSHAEEVGRGVPTSVVAASRDLATAKAVQDILMNPVFRIYITEDVISVELGGALKNVIALSAGICDGLQMGDNTKAALMTRGLAEMMRLGAAAGGNEHTFSGLSGMGDLIVTCSSMHSRNRRAGILIGQGVPPAEAIKSVGTVEGYLAVKTAVCLAAQYGVEMPITEACYRVCYEGASPRAAIAELMDRPKKHENELP